MENENKLKQILVEHYHNSAIIAKLSLGLCAEDNVDDRITELVKNVMGEDAIVGGDEDFKFAESGEDTLVFYTFDPNEETIIWSNPDMFVGMTIDNTNNVMGDAQEKE